MANFGALKDKMLAKNPIGLIRRMMEGTTSLMARRRLGQRNVATMTLRPELNGKTVDMAYTCLMMVPGGRRKSRKICRKDLRTKIRADLIRAIWTNAQ